MNNTTKVLVHTNAPNYPRISYHTVPTVSIVATLQATLINVTGKISAYVNGDHIKII
jgi:hypothetical protein